MEIINSKENINKKAVIIAGNVRSLVANRKDFIFRLKDLGYEVIAFVPEKDFNNSIDELGIQYIKLPLTRQTINPFKDLKVISFMKEKLQEINPDIVFCYTIKPVIYGTIAASKAGVNNIFSMITGLGYVYTGNSTKQRLLKNITNMLYKHALKKNKKIFFQNPDDASEFLKLKLVEYEKVIMINGSGINLKKYQFSPLQDNDHLNVLMISRLIKDKGVFEFIKAARLIKENSKKKKINFHLLGSLDDNPSALSEEELSNLISENIVTYHPFEKDVREKIEFSDVIVLPSYREGTPRAILEGMAMGRAIITTDAPGCCETVKHGENGYLISVGDHEELASYILELSENRDLLKLMGKKSREIAVEKFDVEKVNDILIAQIINE